MGDKSGKKSKGDKANDANSHLDMGNHLDISNHNFEGRQDGADLKTQLKLVKKLNFLGGGPLHGFSSDDSVSDRTEKTFPMDESISSDMDSLPPKPVEQPKETKKGKKKKGEKKSKSEGKSKDKKEKKEKKTKSVKFSE